MFVVLDDGIYYWAATSCPSFLVVGLEGKSYRRMIFVSVAVGLLLPSGSEKSIPYITSR